jgi:excisionase family DNA binding protein
METMYNLKQLKNYYDISERTWREYIKKKELRAFKIGRQYLVSEDDLMVFFKDKEAYQWRKKGTYPFDV